MSRIKGKYFSITDPQNVSTVIYRINKTDEEELPEAPKYTVERLIHSEEFRGNAKRKTFFIDEPLDEEEQLVILSFAKERVVVNMGLLEGNKVKISKKPIPIKFDTLYSEKDNVYKEFNYTPNVKRNIAIIDPETTEEVKPIVYFDKDTNEIKGKCKLIPHKPYFAFEIRDKKD